MLPILIKYINPKHIDDFINGNIHLTPLKNFRIPNENTSEKINDEFEGYLVMRASSKHDDFSLIYNGKEISQYLIDDSYGHSVEAKFTSEDSGKWGIFSCTILDLEDKKTATNPLSKSVKFSILENKFLIYKKIKIRKNFLESLYKEVGNNERIPVLIYPSFLNVLKKRSNYVANKIMFGPVHYYNNYDKTNYDNNDSFEKKQLHVIFEKSSMYKHQREFRIAMMKDCTKKENSSFNIGNIQKNTFVYKSKIPNIEFVFISTLNYKRIKKECIKKHFLFYPYKMLKLINHN